MNDDTTTTPGNPPSVIDEQQAEIDRLRAEQERSNWQIDFGRRVRGRRKAKGLNQIELGDLVGLHSRTIRMYEQGKQSPVLQDVFRFAQVLGVSSSYLVGGGLLGGRDGDYDYKMVDRLGEPVLFLSAGAGLLRALTKLMGDSEEELL